MVYVFAIDTFYLAETRVNYLYPHANLADGASCLHLGAGWIYWSSIANYAGNLTAESGISNRLGSLFIHLARFHL
jgi:hypothetical protein